MSDESDEKEALTTQPATPEQIACAMALHHRVRGPVNPPAPPRMMVPGRVGHREWPWVAPQGATKEERRRDALALKKDAQDRQKAIDDARAERAASLAKMERASG